MSQQVDIEAFDPLEDAREVARELAENAAGDAAREVLRAVAEALASPSVFLPQLPESAIQATQVVDSPRCDVLDLADTLNADPGIAARVVEIANLAFFAGPEPVYTARDAIVRMGIRETRNVVMGVVIRSLICDGPGYATERRKLWEHSLATAACAQGILCELAFADCMGFLAGLVHDLGRSAIYTWLGDRGLRDVSPQVLEPISHQLHPPLAATLLLHWRLRYELIEAVRWHHEPSGCGGGSLVGRALSIADRMAHGWTRPLGSRDTKAELLEALESLGITGPRARALEAENRARLDELMKIL